MGLCDDLLNEWDGRGGRADALMHTHYLCFLLVPNLKGGGTNQECKMNSARKHFFDTPTFRLCKLGWWDKQCQYHDLPQAITD